MAAPVSNITKSIKELKAIREDFGQRSTINKIAEENHEHTQRTEMILREMRKGLKEIQEE